MNKYLVLLCLLLVGCLLIMMGLNMIAATDEVQGQKITIGSEAWCDAMVETPNSQWTEQATQDFARHCLYE